MKTLKHQKVSGELIYIPTSSPAMFAFCPAQLSQSRGSISSSTSSPLCTNRLKPAPITFSLWNIPAIGVVRLNFDKVGLTARHSKIHPHAQFILKTCGNLINVCRSRHRKIRWNCFEDKIVKIVLFRHLAIIVETKAHWHRSNCIEVLQHELPHKRPCRRSNQVDLKIPGLKKLTMTSFT